MLNNSRAVVVIGLTVEFGGSRRDIVAELPYGATVESLGNALAREIDYAPAYLAIEVARTGQTLPDNAAAADCDLRSGDVIRVRGRVPPVAPVEISLRTAPLTSEPLVTLHGARGGRSGATRRQGSGSAGILKLSWADGCVLVTAGDHVVGAGTYSDVVLPVDGLPETGFEVSVTQSSVRLRSTPGGGTVSVNGTVLEGAWHDVSQESRIRAGTAELDLSLEVPDASMPGPVRLSVSDEHARRKTIELGSGGEIAFNRPPRRSSLWRPSTIELPLPPAPVRRVRIPFLAALVPLVAGFAMFMILKSPMMLAFMAISPLMAGGTYLSDRRSGRRDHEEAAARFEAQLHAAGEALYEAVKTEVVERHAQAPQLAAIARWPADHDNRLWERRAFDADFLALPLGWGRLPAMTQVAVANTHGTEPDHRVSRLAAQYQEVDDVPYLVALTEVGALGFAGDRPTSTDSARALALQAALLHSPSELAIAAALPRGADSGWDWIKWLPHTRAGAALLGGPALGAGTNGGDVVRRIAALQERRLDEREARPGRYAASSGPALLVVIDEELQLDRSLVADVLGAARAARTPVIWIGGDPRGLPGHCRVTVDTAPDRSARVIEIDTGVERAPIKLDAADARFGNAIAPTVAPIRDASAAGATASIPGRVRLLDQLGLEAPSGDRLAELWQKPQQEFIAVIGAAGASEAMTIDLRADGPHALIAGTTGAGKSELLRTIVASLAARLPPSRLTFLLVDYKGGAAFAPCRALPHVIDVVSDLDAELGERALISLDAEMKRREHLLADLRADNLIDLERRAPEHAPPNLVIMVDEFAKLREEIPDFIDGVVDIAQRGRTLGIHMVLAAQSLRTSFTPAVRANTNLRIALRVTSETESQDVLDAPDAARIPSGESARGRAFARIGHERLIEFQTAHVSGRYLDPTAAQALVRPFAFGSVLAPSSRRGSGDEAPPNSDETDLAVLARAAIDAAQILSLPAPRAAWTPPLPHDFSREAIQQHTTVAAGICALGLVDDPERQRQVPLTLELDRGHAVIVGIGGSGKTTALGTIAATLAWDEPPSRVQIYGLDAASGALGVITPLPHVGAVVSASDPERVERLLSRLEQDARARSERFNAVGASTLTEYRRRVGAEAPPRVVLLLDGLGEFASAYDDARPGSPFERLISLLGAGRAAGIHVVFTASRRGVLRANVAAHIAHRLLLQQANPEDLIAVGVPARFADRVELTPGRGFTGDGKLFQIAQPAPATHGDAVEGFRDLGAHLHSVWPGQSAPNIDALPDRYPLTGISSVPATITRLPIAIGGSLLTPVTIDLSERHFLVSGPYRSGRSNALGVIAEQAVRTDDVEEIHLLSPRRSPLLERGIWTSVARGAEACGEAAAAVALRLDELAEGPGARVLLLIDDAGELQAAAAWAALERIVRIGRDRGVRILAAAETSAARMLTNTWLRELRKDGQGVLLAPESLADGDILGVSIPRRQTVAMQPGRGYLSSQGRATLVQLPFVNEVQDARSPELSHDRD